jgi:hypothetical protein
MKNRKYVTVLLASFFIAGLLIMGCVLNTSSSEMPTLPIIWAQPLSATYKYGTATEPPNTVAPLDVIAGTSDNGAKLSYEWYQNSTKSNKGGALRSTEAIYTPTIKGTGTGRIEEYYYVVVTSTKGSKSVSQSSEVAVITTKMVDNPLTDISVIAAPVIGIEGTDKLVVNFSEGPSGASYAYQWYKTNQNGKQAILVETGKKYKPPLTEPEDLYYFVAITATDNSKTGIQVRRVTSSRDRPFGITVTPGITEKSSNTVTPNIE